ncbi:MAG: RES family NAD+ phosphorylase [Stenotrophobium sp.]
MAEGAQERLLDTPFLVDGDLHRNIVSIAISQDLSDDLGDGAAVRELFHEAEMTSKRRLPAPAINRPFEPGYGAAILYPFVQPRWFATRFSEGAHPVWYGSTDLRTTVYETVHHFRRNLVQAPGFDARGEVIVGERRVYWVKANALVFDLRDKLKLEPGLVDRHSYAACQALGAQLYRQGHAGVITRSAHCDGDNVDLFDPRFLSNPRHQCYLRYEYQPSSGTVRVLRGQRTMMTVTADKN